MLRTRLAGYSEDGLDRAAMYELFAAQHIHHVGNDEYYGTPFYLEDWQRDNIWNPIFASGSTSGGQFRRRYSTALVGLPRDYGKTEMACCILLTIAMMEPVYNGQYGIIAYSREMGEKILKTLKAMVALDDDLRALWTSYKGKLSNDETGAEIVVFPYSEDAIQSWHFNVVIADELHVWKTSVVWDAIQAGQKDIPNSLCIGITTAGGEQRGFLWDLVQEGTSKDPTRYVWWLGASERAKASDRRVWARLALPSWVTVESIQRQHDKLGRAAFERYVLNRFPEARQAELAIRQGAITRCRRREGHVDFSQRFSVAFDGAVSGDTLAVCAFQRQGEDDVFEEWAWQAEDEGGTYDFMEVADVLSMLARKPGRPQIGGDPARMVTLIKFLQRYDGTECFELRQQPSIMCPASAMLTRSIEGGTACLAQTPVLADHAANCYREESKAYGFRFTSKGSGRTKRHIDMAIAAAMAMYIYDSMPAQRDYSSARFVF